MSYEKKLKNLKSRRRISIFIEKYLFTLREEIKM